MLSKDHHLPRIRKRRTKRKELRREHRRQRAKVLCDAMGRPLDNDFKALLLYYSKDEYFKGKKANRNFMRQYFKDGDKKEKGMRAIGPTWEQLDPATATRETASSHLEPPNC